MMSGEQAIVVENVWKMYHKRAGRGTLLSVIPGLGPRGSDAFWALKDVSFEVRRGECLGIIGPNGAGKSTILKILSRITSPTRGSYRVNGRLSTLIEVGAGFHPELTGRENVYLNAAVLGMGKKEIEGKFNDIVDFAELWDFIDVPVKRYSSGMRVRLGFAVAANLEPDVLLVDEVLAVGDQSFQIKCFRRMRELLTSATVVMVSHNMISIERVCDRALCLENGRVVREGAVAGVIESYLSRGREQIRAERRKPDEQRNPVRFCNGELRKDGPDLRFSIELETNIAIRKPNVVGILWKGDVRVCNLATGQSLPPIQPGRYLVTMIAPRLPLAAGRYHVSVRVREFDTPLHTHGIDGHAATLHVEHDNHESLGLDLGEAGALAPACVSEIKVL